MKWRVEQQFWQAGVMVVAQVVGARVRDSGQRQGMPRVCCVLGQAGPWVWKMLLAKAWRRERRVRGTCSRSCPLQRGSAGLHLGFVMANCAACAPCSATHRGD
eukprot:624027-Pelagomonas_calceolata.AAC.2